MAKQKNKPTLLANYDQALKTIVQAAVNHGCHLHNHNNIVEAKLCYESALIIDPLNFDALNLLGALLSAQKDYERAEKLLNKAVTTNPKSSAALNHLGNVLFATGRVQESLDCFHKAISVNPQDPDPYSNASRVFSSLGDFKQALAYIERAVAINPNIPGVHVNHSNMLISLGLYDQGIEACQKAIALNPNIAMAYNNMGNAYFAKGDYKLALQCFEQTLAEDAGFESSYGQRFEMKQRLCQWENHQQYITQLEQKINEGKLAVMPFPAQSMLGNAAILKKISEQYGVAISQNVHANILPHAPHKKIKIGYYSADFRIHAVGHLVKGLFAAHNTEQFELHGFWYGPDAQDEVRLQIAQTFGQHFYDIRFKSNAEIAQFSRELEIDIAIDLAGYTLGTRVAAFAHRCAPVQVSYIGFPGTLGVDYIDYIIADKQVIPEQYQQHYTEKVIYMPDSYQVNHRDLKISDRQFTRTEMGLPEQGFVYSCFNNGYKLNPSMFDSWARILTAVKGSVLWLVADGEDVRNNLKQEIQARGIEPSRLVFAERMPLEEHFARQRLADVFLDTLPYNGHGTSSAALWAGLPLLTCVGESFPSRVSASLLSALNLPELIAQNMDDYEKKAIEFAKKPQTIKNLRTKLAKNLKDSPLYDINKFTRHLEQAYTIAYQLSQQHKPTEHIELS